MNELVSVCYETVPQSRDRSPCLHKLVNCSFTKTSCGLHYAYHYSGVLLSGKGQVLYLKKHIPAGGVRIWSRDFNKHGLVYVSWKEAEYVQYGEFKVTSPFYVSSAITVRYPDSLLKHWALHINSTHSSFKSEKNDIAQMLADIKSLKTVSRVSVAHEKCYLNYVVLIFSTLSIITTVTFVSWYFCRNKIKIANVNLSKCCFPREKIDTQTPDLTDCQSQSDNQTEDPDNKNIVIVS